MPADTLNEMILGFSVILGLLLLYVVSLFWRIHKAKTAEITPKYPDNARANINPIFC